MNFREEIEDTIEVLARRLPIRALQHMRTEKEISDDELNQYGINDHTIEGLLRAEEVNIRHLVEGKIREVAHLMRGECNQIFSVIDPATRGEANPLLPDVRQLIRSYRGH